MKNKLLPLMLVLILLILLTQINISFAEMTDEGKIKTCVSRGGSFCKDGEICGDLREPQYDSSLGICCRGKPQCIKQEVISETQKTNYIPFYIIGAFILIGLFMIAYGIFKKNEKEKK